MLLQEEHTLANGLRVVLAQQPHVHSTTLCFAVRCGSRHDPPQHPGLSHLLEHMLFRGCKQFPDGAAALACFETAGGMLEAATWRDHTLYWCTIEPGASEACILALGAMICEPHFEGLALERRIVRQEILADVDEVGEDADITNASRAALWRDHPLGRRVTGDLRSLYTMNEAALAEHHRRYYQGEQAAFAVVGPMPGQRLLPVIARAFRNLPSRQATISLPYMGPAANSDCTPPFPRVRPHTLIPSAGSQIAMLLTFPSLPEIHPDFPALQLLTSVLDDGMTSRLPRALCYNTGLLYELNTGLDCYDACGLYDIELHVDPYGCIEAMQIIQHTLLHLAEHGVTRSELAMAIGRYQHHLAFRLDSTEELAQHYATQAAFGRLLAPGEEERRLQAVQLEQVQQLAHQLFAANAPWHITAMGPLPRPVYRYLSELGPSLPKRQHNTPPPTVGSRVGSALLDCG